MAEAPREVKWLELGRDRRRRVARAVRKGRTVDDPRDAPYAVGFADASLEWLSWKRRFRPLHLMLVALVLAELTLSGGWHPALALYPLLGFGFLRLRAPRLRITELQRLGPRSQLQKLYVAWREYEVKLDVWVLGRLEVGDSAAAALEAKRIRSARDYSRKLAGRLGAKICARA